MENYGLVGYKTHYTDLRVGCFVIHTGNSTSTNKNIYWVSLASNEEIKLHKIASKECDWVMKPDNKGMSSLMLAANLDIESLKDLTSYSAYIKYLDLIGTTYITNLNVDGWAVSKATINKQEKTTMKDQAVRANVDAAKTAALITAGGVINQTVLTKLRPQLPMLMRGYADHALADVILANIANFAVANFAKDNDQAVLATEAMMLAAMTKLTSSFNFETILTEILADVKLPDMKESNKEQ